MDDDLTVVDVDDGDLPDLLDLVLDGTAADLRGGDERDFLFWYGAGEWAGESKLSSVYSSRESSIGDLRVFSAGTGLCPSYHHKHRLIMVKIKQIIYTR